MSSPQNRPVFWIASSYDDWLDFPDDVQDVMGYALHLAQCGEKASNAKPLTGFKGASVLEICDDHAGDTYRAMPFTLWNGEIFRCDLCPPCFPEEKQKGSNSQFGSVLPSFRPGSRNLGQGR